MSVHVERVVRCCGLGQKHVRDGVYDSQASSPSTFHNATTTSRPGYIPHSTCSLLRELQSGGSQGNGVVDAKAM
jgi:hypothetical protein